MRPGPGIPKRDPINFEYDLFRNYWAGFIGFFLFVSRMFPKRAGKWVSAEPGPAIEAEPCARLICLAAFRAGILLRLAGLLLCGERYTARAAEFFVRSNRRTARRTERPGGLSSTLWLEHDRL
jgi:hypothetical protein